jgi:RNA polymerase sigma-70 factor, ECF subfamily
MKANVYQSGLTETDISFEELVDKNQDKILNLIYGMIGDYHLAQDLTQEVFIKAFQALGTFHGESKHSTWLYKIAVNHTIDHQRKACVRRERTASEDQFEKTPTDTEPDSSCQKTAIRNILFRSIAELPDQQKEVYILREINGCTTKEVAEILGCSIELVKWRLHKARSLLKKVLSSKNQYGSTGTFSLTAKGIE